MDELQISGKRFISSRWAAKENGYTSDYMGQLIRAGKVRGQKVGRAWYIEADSLASYLASGGAPVEAAEPAAEEVAEEVIETPVAEIEAVAPAIEAAEEIEEPTIEPALEELAHEPITVRIEPVRMEPAPVPVVAEKVSDDADAPAVIKIRKTKTEGLTYVPSEEPFIPRVESRQAVTSVMPAAHEEIEAEQEVFPPAVAASRGWGDAGVLFAGFAVFIACAVLGSSMAATLHLEGGSPASAGYVIEW